MVPLTGCPGPIGESSTLPSHFQVPDISLAACTTSGAGWGGPDGAAAAAGGLSPPVFGLFWAPTSATNPHSTTAALPTMMLLLIWLPLAKFSGARLPQNRIASATSRRA